MNAPAEQPTPWWKTRAAKIGAVLSAAAAIAAFNHWARQGATISDAAGTAIPDIDVGAAAATRTSPVAHGVREHMRNQPHGPGRELRRPVTIPGHQRGIAA